MRAVPKVLMNEKHVKRAYGFDANFLKNVTMDIGKKDRLGRVTKKALFLCKTVKNVGMVRKIFAKICVEKLERCTRWSCTLRQGLQQYTELLIHYTV